MVAEGKDRMNRRKLLQLATGSLFAGLTLRDFRVSPAVQRKPCPFVTGTEAFRHANATYHMSNREFTSSLSQAYSVNFSERTRE